MDMEVRRLPGIFLAGRLRTASCTLSLPRIATACFKDTLLSAVARAYSKGSSSILAGARRVASHSLRHEA